MRKARANLPQKHLGGPTPSASEPIFSKAPLAIKREEIHEVLHLPGKTLAINKLVEFPATEHGLKIYATPKVTKDLEKLDACTRQNALATMTIYLNVETNGSDRILEGKEVSVAVFLNFDSESFTLLRRSVKYYITPLFDKDGEQIVELKVAPTYTGQYTIDQGNPSTPVLSHVYTTLDVLSSPDWPSHHTLTHWWSNRAKFKRDKETFYRENPHLKSSDRQDLERAQTMPTRAMTGLKTRLSGFSVNRRSETM
ncbi:MAG: hypothetical protein Q9162_000334 [Coniocarpon cinnabarinum]